MQKNLNKSLLNFKKNRIHLNHDEEMKNILIIGATGQIGSELTMKLRSLYPEGNVVAGYIPGAEPKGALLESGPSHIVDITNPAQIAEASTNTKSTPSIIWQPS